MYSLTRYARSISLSSPLRSICGTRTWASQIPFDFGATSEDIGTRVTTGQGSQLPGRFGSGSDSISPTMPRYLRNFPSLSNFGERRGQGPALPSRPMDFVRGVIEEDAIQHTSMPRFQRPKSETNADFVHIKMHKNNTFVVVTDSKGNVKCQASSGCLPELKGGPKLSRYAAEATAEYVGRKAKEMGLKSVVVKVNGFVHFKKKRQAIMSFREGFTNSRSDQNPIVHIEDTTRRPHNGCRLRKKRRV